MTAFRVSLTIGIPTFNRAEAVERRLLELLASDLAPDVRILVIDNHSDDDTLARISVLSDPRLTVLSNKTNLGYAGNVLRLFDEAESDYLMVVSDEDRVSVEALEDLIRFCVERRPQFVSPRAEVRNNSLYRGRATSRLIEPEEFESSAFYVSGLTFDLAATERDTEVLRPLIVSNEAARLYPQVILAALAVARDSGYFFDEVVTTQVESLETHIAGEGGIGSYRSVPARWLQFSSYEAFFAADYGDLLPAGGPARMAAMRERKRSTLGAVLKSAAVLEVPEVGQYLERSISQLVRAAIAQRLRR